MLIILRVVMLSGLLFVLAGCKYEDVPPGAELRFDPPVVEWTVKPNYTVDSDDDGVNDRNCVIIEGYYNDSYVLATMTDSVGRPLLDFDVRLHLDLTENTFTGYPVLKLYEDKNSNGVVDGEQEFVSALGDDGWTKKTDVNGGVHLLVRVNMSCPFSGNLSGFGGLTANKSMNFSVAAE